MSSCENCKYFVEQMLSCSRYPDWIEVGAEHFCGEYKAKAIPRKRMDKGIKLSQYIEDYVNCSGKFSKVVIPEIADERLRFYVTCMPDKIEDIYAKEFDKACADDYAWNLWQEFCLYWIDNKDAKNTYKKDWPATWRSRLNAIKERSGR